MNVLQPKVAGQPNEAAGTIQEMGQLAQDVAANKNFSPMQLPTGVNPEVERLREILQQAKGVQPRQIQGMEGINTSSPEALKSQLSQILPKAGMQSGELQTENKLKQVFDFLKQGKTPEEMADLQQRMTKINENYDLLKGKKAPKEVNASIPSLVEKAVGGAGNVANLAGRAIKTTNEFLTQGVSKLSNASPETIKAVADELSSKGPQGQAYAQQLSDAADKNSQSRNAIIFSLMQQPAFRKMFHPEEDQK